MKAREIAIDPEREGNSMDDGELVRRTGAIATRHQKAFLSKRENLPALLHHYTTAEVLRSIIDSRTIWATDLRYMNDAEELTYPRNLVSKVFADTAAARKRPVSEKLVRSIRERVNWHFYRYFGASFSEEPDLLGQWRGYGEGSRVSIAFDFRWCEPQGYYNGILLSEPLLLPVVYEPEEQHAVAAGIMNDLLDLADECEDPESMSTLSRIGHGAFQSLILPLLSFKNPVWREEREWRMVVLEQQLGRADHVTEKFRPCSLGIAPYIEVAPLDYAGPFTGRFNIRGVTVGPTPHPDLARAAVEELLLSRGYGANFTPVTNSSIALR